MLWVILMILNSFCLGLNIYAQHWWVVPINGLAIVGCLLSIYNDMR